MAASSPENTKNIDWEFLEVPPLIQHSSKTATKENSSNAYSDFDVSPKKENKERLCGYLSKLGAKGLIKKSWKVRWFVYDHRRCLLYYYRKPQDGEPLGNIDISNATFSYSTDEKRIFQISSQDRTYRLEAEDQNTMMFWLQELQAKRREFGKQQEQSIANMGPTSGLLSYEQELDNDVEDNADTGLNKQVEKPVTIGENAATSKENSWNLSFTNLNKEFKNWRKSAFNPLTGEPLSSDTTLSSNTSPTQQQQQQLNLKELDLKQSDGRNSKMVDFGFSKLVSNIRRPVSSPIVSLPTNQGNKYTCQECQETYSMVSILKEAISVAEKEITTRDEVIQSLSEQLRFATTSPIVEKSPDEEVSEEREQYILQLTRMVRRLTKEMDEVKLRLSEKDEQISEYVEQQKVLKELIYAKDNSIISLTNKIFSFEQSETGEDVSELTEESPALTNGEQKEMLLDYNQLEEACSAIRAQNNFLNSEILELNRLRTIDSEKAKMSVEKLTQKEAEFLKLKSRYLWLLKEFSAPKRGEIGVSTEMVEHLIDDAINENQEDSPGTAEHRFSDRYGFYDMYDKEDAESLENLADHFDVLSGDKENDSLEVSHAVRWENFLVAQGNNSLVKTEESKYLTRCSIPHEFRAKVWNDLIKLRIGNEKDMAGPGYYIKLLKDKQGIYTPSSKQIELDLLRTLPNNKYYDKIDSEGTAKLRRILLAYSWHNPTVGYCQGLNRIGAIALLYLDEESAFWCLVDIVEHLMPVGYYSRTLLGAQVDQRVFRDLMDEKFPKLGNHLQSIKFDLSLISFNWFLTVFVDFFPIELSLRVWDTFLFEGSKVLFRYALAVFKTFEEDLIKYDDAGSIFNFFRKVPKSRFNIPKIINTAFGTLNPFPRRNIESKRRYYRPILQAQLDEFEVLRQEYREKRVDTLTNGDAPVSDDDN